MNLFLPRLRELLAESGKMQKDICDELGISKQKISNWKTGYSEPNFDDIIMLAKYFDVSSDYLLGLTDEYEGTGKSAPTAPTALPLDESELLRNYRALSYSGKARVAAYTDLLREQEEGAPSKISNRK